MKFIIEIFPFLLFMGLLNTTEWTSITQWQWWAWVVAFIVAMSFRDVYMGVM